MGRVSAGEKEKVLKMDGGDANNVNELNALNLLNDTMTQCTLMYLMTQNHTFKKD